MNSLFLVFIKPEVTQMFLIKQVFIVHMSEKCLMCTQNSISSIGKLPMPIS